MSNNYSQGTINPNLPTLTSWTSLPHSETEDYFEVDHDLHVDADSNEFTDFTFGHEQTWVKYNKTEFWMAKALQYLVLYIIADHRPQVSLLASSQQFCQNPQSTVFSNPMVNRSKIITQLSEKLTAFIKSSCSPSSQIINDNQAHDFLEWIVNIWKYYSQQKAKINMICTKISQKPKAHWVLKNFMNSLIRKQSGSCGSLKSEEKQEFKQFNENSGLGIELKGAMKDDNFVIITNKVDDVGYCLYITQNKFDNNQVRVRISSNRKQYLKNFSELMSNQQQIPIMQNSSFGCQSGEKLLENNTLISQQIDTEQQSNQSIKMDDNESIMIESEDGQEKSEPQKQAQKVKEEEEPTIKPTQNEIKVTHNRIPSFLYMRNKTESTHEKQPRFIGKVQKDPIQLSDLCKKKLKSEQDEQIDGAISSNRPYSNYMPVAYPPLTLTIHQPYNNRYQYAFAKQSQGLNKSSLTFSQTRGINIPKIKFTYNAITTKPNY